MIYVSSDSAPTTICSGPIASSVPPFYQPPPPVKCYRSQFNCSGRFISAAAAATFIAAVAVEYHHLYSRCVHGRLVSSMPGRRTGWRTSINNKWLFGNYHHYLFSSHNRHAPSSLLNLTSPSHLSFSLSPFLPPEVAIVDFRCITWPLTHSLSYVSYKYNSCAELITSHLRVLTRNNRVSSRTTIKSIPVLTLSTHQPKLNYSN